MNKVPFNYADLTVTSVDDAVAEIRSFPVFKHVCSEWVQKNLAKDKSTVTVSKEEFERLQEVDRQSKKRSLEAPVSTGEPEPKRVVTVVNPSQYLSFEDEHEYEEGEYYEAFDEPAEEGEYEFEDVDPSPSYYTRGVGRGTTSQRSRVARAGGIISGSRSEKWEQRKQERRQERNEEHRQRRGSGRGNRGGRGVRGVRGGRVYRGGRAGRRGRGRGRGVQ